MIIGIIGGTGNLGYGLAVRWAQAGFSIMIGSREKGKAEESAESIAKLLPDAVVSGESNEVVASKASVVVLSIPFSGHKNILSKLEPYVIGKIVLDTTVPIVFDNKSPMYDLPEIGSAGEGVQNLLPNAKVVSGLHTVSAGLLTELDHQIDCDSLICGDDSGAKQVITDLGAKIGLAIFDAGPLGNAQSLERLTPLIIGLNKKYKRKHIGLKLTGV